MGIDTKPTMHERVVAARKTKAALKRKPGVGEAIVVAEPNEDGLTRLALFVVPKDEWVNPRKLEEELTTTLRNTLSIYKCPRTIRFLDELPRTATGKVQKYRLREFLRAQA